MLEDELGLVFDSKQLLLVAVGQEGFSFANVVDVQKGVRLVELGLHADVLESLDSW